jgi:hypothetical protein
MLSTNDFDLTYNRYCTVHSSSYEQYFVRYRKDSALKVIVNYCTVATVQ